MQRREKNKIACPVCQNAPLPQMNNMKFFWYCNNCSLGWIKKKPRTIYETNYYTSGSSILAKAFSPIEFCFYKIRESYFGLQKKKLYIDVGAGDGNYLTHVNAERKIGVEISVSGRKKMANKGLQTLSQNEFLKIKNKKADYISFWQVIEHVNTPIAYLKATKNNLSKNGKVLIAVPNINSFEFRIFKRYWFHLTPEYHVWFFSPKALNKMLTLAGLKIERIDYWAIEHQLAGIVQSCINRTTNTNNTLHKLIKRKQDLSTVSFKTIFWIVFWCTVGIPFILIFWAIASLFKKSGAIVVIASKI